MKKDKLRSLILSLVQDVVFSYNNKDYCINPYTKHKFEVGCNDDVILFDNIEKLMAAKIFDGQCLNDISNKIILYTP